MLPGCPSAQFSTVLLHAEVETRGALLPLAAATASLLPASRRVPGPVAGLHRTHTALATHNLWSTHTLLNFFSRTSKPVRGTVGAVGEVEWVQKRGWRSLNGRRVLSF